MLKTSLLFAAIALVAFLLADLEVSTQDPWLEVGRMAKGVVTPDFLAIWGFWNALLNTVVFALCGICLAVVFGIVLAFFFRFTAVRLFCAFIRAIHEIFWAFIFLSVVGLNSVCGVLAIAIPYAGIFAKVYAEIVQESDRRPLEGVPTRCGGLSRFVYGILPVIYADAKHYTGYRFECALRSSAILGFIGLPTLGFHLETAFREGLYSEAAALLYVFYLLIASLRYWVKARLIPLYAAAAFILLSWEITLSWTNVLRFFTYEILPWPMRQEGVSTGSYAVSYAWQPVWQWTREIIVGEGWKGIRKHGGFDPNCIGRNRSIHTVEFSVCLPTFHREDRRSNVALFAHCFCAPPRSIFLPSCLCNYGDLRCYRRCGQFSCITGRFWLF